MERWDSSWLLLHPQPESAQALEQAAAWFDRSLNDPNLLVITDESSVKIEHVRDLQQEVASVSAGGKGRVVLITPGEKITLPAQQALLKLLEEPPHNTVLAIIAGSQSAVLPTIVSRCRVAVLQKNEQGRAGVLERIAQAQTLKEAVSVGQTLPTKREELAALLTSELQSITSSETSPELVAVAEKALQVLEAVKSNVIPSLCVDELCLFRFRKSR